MESLTFPETVSIISNMVLPVVLILATLNLISTTSQRSGKVMDRVRELLTSITVCNTQNTQQQDADTTIRILKILAKRSRFLQRSLWFQYLALCDFLATSGCLAIFKLLEFTRTEVPLLLGFLGILLIFCASIMLGFESRIAIKGLEIELKEAFREINSGRKN